MCIQSNQVRPRIPKVNEQDTSFLSWTCYFCRWRTSSASWGSCDTFNCGFKLSWQLVLEIAKYRSTATGGGSEEPTRVGQEGRVTIQTHRGCGGLWRLNKKARKGGKQWTRETAHARTLYFKRPYAALVKTFLYSFSSSLFGLQLPHPQVISPRSSFIYRPLTLHSSGHHSDLGWSFQRSLQVMSPANHNCVLHSILT